MTDPQLPTNQRSQIVLFRTLLLTHTNLMASTKKILRDTCGVSMMQFDMIAELGGREAMRMGELSEKMITSPSNVTRVAQSLEKMGILERRRAVHSEREVLAQLTEKGEAFFEEHFGAVAQQIAAIFDEELEPAEQVQLSGLLRKLAKLTR